MDLKETVCKDVDWINAAQQMVHRRAALSMAIKLGFNIE
jgi:hypothetical protein